MSATMAENNTPKPPNTCSSCDATWTGISAAHCAAEKSVVIPLTVDTDGPGLFAEDTSTDGRAGQRLRIAAMQLADLVSEEAGVVRTGHLAEVEGTATYRAELNGGDWTSVRWSIAGPMAVDITDYIIEYDRGGSGQMLAGFEVRNANRKNTRLMIAAQPANHRRSRGKPAVGHWFIQITAACHRTFASVTLFDLHRAITDNDGRCIKPSDVVCKGGPDEGQRLIFFRDGMWRARELTPIERARIERNRIRRETVSA